MYALSQSHRICGRHSRFMAALVVGGALPDALLPLLYFLQTVQKVSPISAIVQLMPLMVAAIGKAGAKF